MSVPTSAAVRSSVAASSIASPSASSSASAASSASTEKLPESCGDGRWVAMAAALALLMCCGIGAIAFVRRSFT
jgi:hypothetical protein